MRTVKVMRMSSASGSSGGRSSRGSGEFGDYGWNTGEILKEKPLGSKKTNVTEKVDMPKESPKIFTRPHRKYKDLNVNAILL